MYITWKYDLFPYELCGKVKENKGNNLYTVEGYDGMRFEAKRKMNDQKGVVIKGMLERAGQAYLDDKAKLNQKHRNYIALRFANILEL